MEGGKVYFIAGLNIDQYSNNSLEIIWEELRWTWIVINGVMGCIQQKIIRWNKKEKKIGIQWSTETFMAGKLKTTKILSTQLIMCLF